MRYTQIDGNVAALFRHQEQLDQDYRDDEIYEKGAAEKPMDEQATALIEEYVIQKAFFEVMGFEDDDKLEALESAIKRHAADVDKERGHE